MVERSIVEYEMSIEAVLKELFTAPLNHPDIVPNLLPIIVGALVIELYFGKYRTEELGWNTSVGNAIVWVTTGLTLVVTEEPEGLRLYASLLLIGLGSFVGYMNFYHRWSETVAFVISSAGVIYSLAYVIVVVVMTDIPINETVIKSTLAFIVIVNLGFRILQGFETPRDTGVNI